MGQEDIVGRLGKGFPSSGERLDEVDGGIDLWWRMFEVSFNQEVVLRVGHLYPGFVLALVNVWVCETYIGLEECEYGQRPLYDHLGRRIP